MLTGCWAVGLWDCDALGGEGGGADTTRRPRHHPMVPVDPQVDIDVIAGGVGR